MGFETRVSRLALSLLAVAALAVSAVLCAAGCGKPKDAIKIGVIAPFSGPFASIGAEMQDGIKAYLKQHGDTVAGRKIEVLYRDTTGPSPEIAKRLAQELVVRDQVDFLAGFGLTPEALAVAPVATEAKKPMVIMNAATSIITEKSPYIVRVSFTLAQVTAPLATWAAKNGIQSVYTLVSDYGPGLDAEATFKKTFTAAGGTIVDSVRVPLQNPDFSPYVQRVKDAHPQALFAFLPTGQQGIAFMKAIEDRGLAQAGIRLLATGDVTEDNQLAAMGPSVLGTITTHHYSRVHDSPENKAFLAAFADVAGGQLRPNFMAVGGYDGMAAIASVCEKLGGKIDGDAAMALFKGMTIQSPRGAIRIDPETRDVVQAVYVRHVAMVDGQLANVELDKFDDVKDPGK
jgi:branched-chain amino acid transport system substrate-binding protein